MPFLPPNQQRQSTEGKFMRGHWQVFTFPPNIVKTEQNMMTILQKLKNTVSATQYMLYNVYIMWHTLVERLRVDYIPLTILYTITALTCNTKKHLPCVPKKVSPLNILQQQPQICSDLNKILHTKDDICYKHYYIVSYLSLIHIWRCRRSTLCRSRWSPYH